jgi:hypothetical protein
VAALAWLNTPLTAGLIQSNHLGSPEAAEPCVLCEPQRRSGSDFYLFPEQRGSEAETIDEAREIVNLKSMKSASHN